eukprot:3657034-Pyramimonas_sp.AAC.1
MEGPPPEHPESIVPYGSTSLVPVTRVMGPNRGLHEGIFDDVHAICPICQTAARELLVCAGCGAFGHAECLRLELFFDYTFCQACIPKVAAEYA